MDFKGEFDASGEVITGSPNGRIQGLTDLDSRNWSVFGQGEYDFSPRLTGIVGLRWSQDHKKIKFTTLGFGMEDQGIPNGGVIFDYAEQIAANPEFAGDDKINYGDVAARAQLNYKPHRDLLFYLSYNRGIKGGNWSPAPTVSLADFRHTNEVLDSYEVGMKSTIAPGTRLNVAAFYYDYHDYQAFSLTNLQPQVTNSDATVKGAEIELFTRPLRNLDLAIGAAFLDSNVDFVPAVIPGTGTTDAELPQAPHVSLNALARYSVPVHIGTLALQVDGRYAGKHFLEGTNSEVSFQRSYAVANGSVSLTSNDERWQGIAVGQEFHQLEVQGLQSRPRRGRVRRADVRTAAPVRRDSSLQFQSRMANGRDGCPVLRSSVAVGAVQRPGDAAKQLVELLPCRPLRAIW